MALTRRLAAILAADVVGYSRLIGLDEAGTVEALREHRAAADPIIAEHGGRVFKTTGDGLLIEFRSIVGAVECALGLQRLAIEQNAETPAERRMEWRIGVHLGDVLIEGEDILGDGVNIAARLEGIAEPGGICISEDAFRQVRGKVAPEFVDIGEQSLKNIARPLRVYRVGSSPAARQPISPAVALPLPDKPSIAVLPFQNMSGDPEQEFFADGIVEEITTALSKLRWFFVIARNSTFAYKNRGIDVTQVGRELGVRYVLEGSVRKGGNRVRVTAQLVEAETGNHVWAERYDRDIGDIFVVQDEITEHVVAAIEPELYAVESTRSRRKSPESLDAWECVIRALSLIGQGTREANAEAEQLCQRAIAIAPGYGQAHSLLAWALLRRTTWSRELRTTAAEISAQAQAALGLDDRDPWAYLVQGNLLTRLRRFDDAVRTLRRALELNPNFALAHAQLGAPLAHLGAHREAADTAQHALRLSPNDRNVVGQSARSLMLVRFAEERYAECVTWARTLIENSAEHVAGHMFLTAALAMQGELAATAEARDTLLLLWPQFSLAWMTETPASGEMAERLRLGLRKAGIPEE